ncbi:RNA polymerase factor sigma-54 [Planctellipticum variicoloris]|uniref:RNA polymerase factor sigma-54 n=1 Tax=Planctellipticum variicoloris TaxID=3064265 RepID=UPI003013FE40
MQLNFSQQMKMSQQMKLAPRMIQSMEILQLPIMALQERIEQELAENVCLENPLGDSEAPGVEEELQAAREEADEKPIAERELVVDADHENAADFERLMEMSSDWPEDNYTSGSKPSSNRIDESSDRQHDVIANITQPSQSLHDYLLEQYGYFSVPVEVREFGEFIIQNLDHNGRLQNALPELMQVYGRTISLRDAQQALANVQKLDPPGVGARDVRECLLLQITPETPHRDCLVTLITSHLEDLAQNRLPLIEKKTGYSIEEIKAAHQELLNLNPYPGAGFEVRPVQNVTPDLFVEQDDHGHYVVRLEDEYTPRLRISKKYQQLIRDGADAQTREYIKRKIDSAKWLIESIEQRHNTLKRVAQAIVDHQTDFLENGPEAIVPLKMQQIADVVGVHVTTVSRAVDDKWIQTPRGLFPLKRFFGGGTVNSEGEEVAWDIIRLKLKEIVGNEDKNDPLSDDALVEELAKEGYQLARRTVTKYRKALNIPSSRQRKAY